MEIELKDVLIKDTPTSFSLKNTELTAIYGLEIDPLFLLRNLSGTIIINKTKITEENRFEYYRKIALIKQICEKTYLKTVNDYMEDFIREKNLSMKDASKKIIDSLKIVGLPKETVIREYHSLSHTEKYFVSLAINLLLNPLIIILEEPFNALDLKQEKKLMALLVRLKEKYNKYIIIVSKNSNKLYKYTDRILIFKNKLLLNGPTKEIYQRVDFLRKNRILIPEIVELTYIAKKNKNVKLDYHRDIRDIIKDIYKHI